MKQTLREIEIILVDDGSPDRCGAVCDEYAVRDERIKVVHKANGGLVSARNAGYEAVTGVWHTYVDGDDWIDPDMCQRLMDAVNGHHDVDIVFWKCVQELGDKSIKGKWEWACDENERMYVGAACRELARHTLVYKSGIATAYCKLINTSYARRTNLRHDDRLRQGAEGLEFSLRAFYHAQHAQFVNAYWYHYLYNPDSISKRVDERNTACLTDCLRVIEEDIRGFDNATRYYDTLLQRTVYILIAIAMSTYFHPLNPDRLAKRVRSYAAVIAGYALYGNAIRSASTQGMDKLRRLVLFLLRRRWYVLLDPIGRLKQYMLKRGNFNY